MIEHIDLVLFAAMCLDLFFKNRKYYKVKKKMPHWRRYQYNTTKLRDILYSLILLLSLFYFVYRIYAISQNNSAAFPKICIFIPLIDYYVLWDWFLHGIYYNRKSIYYKSELYEFRRAVHIYRYLVKDHYEYEMIYRQKEGGLQNVLIRIPNEKEAYELLSIIPFEEEEQS